MTQSLGDYLKELEAETTSRKLDPKQYVYARLDGRAFHTFTRELDRPSKSFMYVMQETTKSLVHEFKPKIAYVQSDEISLIWEPVQNEMSQFIFDGKIYKLTSLLASYCSASFSQHYQSEIGKLRRIPSFDCRVLNLSEEDCQKMLRWRRKDCWKNSITMIAEKHFSHKQLHGKTTEDRISMLKERGVQLAKEDPYFIWGTTMRLVTVKREPNEEDRKRIPAEHLPEIIIRNEIEKSHEIDQRDYVKFLDFQH